MARFISVEIDASQLRVAEIEEVGRKERILQCFSIPMPQGMTEDGEVRDTKNLAELLVQGLEAHAIKSKKIYFVAGSSRIARQTAVHIFLWISANMFYLIRFSARSVRKQTAAKKPILIVRMPEIKAINSMI